MSILNIDEIRSSLGNDIIIHPFHEKNLKGIGYNLRVAPIGWSVNTKCPLKLVKTNTGYSLLVPPNDIALVMTREIIFVDNGIAGTFHSKVDKVSSGFSHVSTTLDPNWIGPLLIALANNKDRILDLRVDDTFVTLLFYRINKTVYAHENPSPSFLLVNQ